MGWSNDFRGSEFEVSWVYGLGSREGGSREREVNYFFGFIFSIEGWEGVRVGLFCCLLLWGYLVVCWR